MFSLIITEFTADYKEQVVIIDIKSKIQCLICTVPNCEQEN